MRVRGLIQSWCRGKIVVKIGSICQERAWKKMGGTGEGRERWTEEEEEGEEDQEGGREGEESGEEKSRKEKVKEKERKFLL